MKKLSILVDKKIIYVDYEVTNNKNMYLKVAKDNTIKVSAPKFVSEKNIKTFVLKHIKKFLSYTEKDNTRKLYSLRENYIYLNGLKMVIRVLTGFLRPKYKMENNVLYLSTQRGTEEENEALIKELLMKISSNYIKKRQLYFEKKMDVPEHKVKIIYKTSTWGTNNIRTRLISYSSKLAHFSNKVKDYLIVHELAHYRHHNHSSEF